MATRQGVKAASGAEVKSEPSLSRPITVSWASRTFVSLRFPEYRKLWISMLLAMGGLQMQIVARGVLTYDITDSRQLTGIVSMGFAPTMLLFSLFGGVIGDRFEKRFIIQISQLGSVINSVAMGVLIVTQYIHWSHLLAASLLQGALFAFQMPARQAAIPSMVPRDKLTNAVSMNATAMSLMAVVAPGIAGLLYSQFGPAAVYFVISALTLSAFLFTSKLSRIEGIKGQQSQSVLSNVRAGLSYIAHHPLLRLLMIQGAIVALLSIPFRTVIQIYARDIYGASPGEVGILLVASGVGGLAGSIFIAGLRQGQRRGIILLSAAFIAGVSLALIASFPFYIVGIIGMAGLGLGEAGRWALGQSLLMELSEDTYKARVMSVFMMIFGLMPLGIFPLTWAMDVFGGQLAAAGLAAALLVSTALLSLIPRMRRIA